MGVSAAFAVLLLLITLRWKISGHSIAIASLAILVIHVMGQNFLPALLAIPLVAWARIRIRRHTLAQTIAGAALGMLYISLIIM
jgi:membrane-associated phospholipid phosphatase